jgi:hypothetical protein
MTSKKENLVSLTLGAIPYFLKDYLNTLKGPFVTIAKILGRMCGLAALLMLAYVASIPVAIATAVLVGTGMLIPDSKSKWLNKVKNNTTLIVGGAGAVLALGVMFGYFALPTVVAGGVKVISGIVSTVTGGAFAGIATQFGLGGLLPYTPIVANATLAVGAGYLEVKLRQ